MRYLVTGANRGIGLEFVKQLTSRGEEVIATARNVDDAKALKTLAGTHNNLTIISLDVSKDDSIDALSASVGEELDVLINNAGCYGHSGVFPDLDFDLLERDYRINAIGTLKVSAALLESLKKGKGKIIASVTSKMGSIGDNSSGGSYSYRMSKTGLNMASRSMAHDLSKHDISVFVLHPGWVQTDMGGSNALINTQTSVEGMLKTIDKATLDHSGRFWEWNGNEIQW